MAFKNRWLGNWTLILTLEFSLQSSVLHSQPKSTVGTPAYIAPEVLARKEYDGKVVSDLLFLIFNGHTPTIKVPNLTIYNLGCWRLVMWSNSICDACWCVPLWGPWRTKKLPQDNYCELPNNHIYLWVPSFHLVDLSSCCILMCGNKSYKILAADTKRTIHGSWLCSSFDGMQTSSVPDFRGKPRASNSSLKPIVPLEQNITFCSVFTSHFLQRITIPEIKNHPWFLKNLPIEMTDEYQMSVQMNDINTPSQGLEEIMAIIQEARKPGDGSKFSGQIPGLGSMELDDIDTDDIDVEDSGDFVCALWRGRELAFSSWSVLLLLLCCCSFLRAPFCCCISVCKRGAVDNLNSFICWCS